MKYATRLEKKILEGFVARPGNEGASRTPFDIMMIEAGVVLKNGFSMNLCYTFI